MRRRLTRYRGASKAPIPRDVSRGSTFECSGRHRHRHARRRRTAAWSPARCGLWATFTARASASMAAPKWRDRLRHLAHRQQRHFAEWRRTATLTGAGNFAENCYIHHAGVFYKQGVGVALERRRPARVALPHPRYAALRAFSFPATATCSNTIIFAISRWRRRMSAPPIAAGATGSARAARSSATISSTTCSATAGTASGPRLISPGASTSTTTRGGVDVIGNIVARCGRSLMHGHSARDCRVENNIFVEGGQRQWEFNGWTTKHRFWTDHLPADGEGLRSPWPTSPPGKSCAG